MKNIFLVLLIAPLFASTCLAGDWRVVPIKLYLNARLPSSSVRLVNNDKQPLNLQMAAFEWSQNETGEDVYTPSDELIFFPRMMSIPPGEERILRAGIKIPATDREKTFRVFIEEIPQPERGGASAVTVAVRFGLPVFVAPLAPKNHAEILDFALKGNTATATVKNLGNQHLLPNSISLVGLDDKDKEIFNHKIDPWYVLVDSTRTFSYALKPEEVQQVSHLQLLVSANEITMSKTLVR